MAGAEVKRSFVYSKFHDKYIYIHVYNIHAYIIYTYIHMCVCMYILNFMTSIYTYIYKIYMHT